MIEALEAILEGLWRDLDRGCRDARSPYWRPVVAVVHPSRGPLASTVVLRCADQGASSVEFYVDARSAKAVALAVDPRAALTWFESKSRVQVRAEGTCALHQQDDVARSRWLHVGPSSRRLYGAQPAPGAQVDRPEDVEVAIPEGDGSAFDHFVVVRCRIHHLDRLLLGRDGQERAVFERLGAGWIGTWAAP